MRGAWKAESIFALAGQPLLKHAVLEGPRTLPLKPGVEWVSHGGTENTEGSIDLLIGGAVASQAVNGHAWWLRLFFVGAVGFELIEVGVEAGFEFFGEFFAGAAGGLAHAACLGLDRGGAAFTEFG